MGGIFDHLGGGFHRYSVTEDWHIPQYIQKINKIIEFFFLVLKKCYMIKHN